MIVYILCVKCCEKNTFQILVFAIWRHIVSKIEHHLYDYMVFTNKPMHINVYTRGVTLRCVDC